VVIGDSISAGWGSTGECCGTPGCRSDPCAADGTASYGAVAATRLGLDVQIIASGGRGFGLENKSECADGAGPDPLLDGAPDE
jgi:hypothetical protein